ncbi:MAG: hypothetical protein ACP5IM_04190 [Candidatus Bathyarchaeia archaeon]
MSQSEFSKIILSTVDESLSTLGDSPKQAIMFHLENSFNIKKETIPTNITDFVKALEEIFGPGASYLEKLIVKHINAKLSLTSEDIEKMDFLEYVEQLKRRLLSKEG